MRKSFSIVGALVTILLLGLFAGIHSVWSTFFSDAFTLFIGAILWLVSLAMSFGAWIGGLLQ